MPSHVDARAVLDRLGEHSGAGIDDGTTPRRSAEALYKEIVLDGRRYMLVPVEASGGVNGDRVGVSPVADDAPDDPMRALSEREGAIVRLVASGMVNKQIAFKLQISEHTVSTYLRRIFAKLGVDTRAAMVSRYLSSRGRR